ncbi:class I SAM-dependent methyltransferase [Paenibacillus sp. KN14-4R]|uniref:class I SAM-dependent methyltransferase n=1 Tax=Paenibacillus sp. KN14-4R TaxID=3445773 RepID=UPI003F9EFD51
MKLNAMSRVQQKWLFLMKFILAPAQIGSVTPSSKYLAQKMVDCVPWNEVTRIAELGAGTGAITKYIHTATWEEISVLLFEKDAEMRSELERQYPDFRCYEDCRELIKVMHKEQIDQLDCIFSGLPFFNFPQVMRDQILEQIVGSLRDDGWFIAFQYSKQMQQQLMKHFEIEMIHYVLWNLPPAFIYVCRKRRGEVNHEE